MIKVRVRSYIFFYNDSDIRHFEVFLQYWTVFVLTMERKKNRVWTISVMPEKCDFSVSSSSLSTWKGRGVVYLCVENMPRVHFFNICRLIVEWRQTIDVIFLPTQPPGHSFRLVAPHYRRVGQCFQLYRSH